jgi:molybdopterin converting factor small subunit
MATIWVPALVRKLTGGNDRVVVPGRTVAEAIDALDRIHPGVRARLCDGPALRPGLAVVIGAQVARNGLETPITDDDEVHFVQAIGGG